MKRYWVMGSSGLALLACAALVGCGTDGNKCGAGTRDEAFALLKGFDLPFAATS